MDVTLRSGTVKLEWRYFEFAQDVTSVRAKRVIESADRERPWRAATATELLAFGAQHKDEQRKHPIIALGSSAIINTQRRVAFLRCEGHRRNLGLEWWSGLWQPNCRFLAVRAA